MVTETPDRPVLCVRCGKGGGTMVKVQPRTKDTPAVYVHQSCQAAWRHKPRRR